MGERGGHDVFRRFEVIAREVDRLRSFETALPEGLLRLRRSVDLLARSSIALPHLRLDQAQGPAERLVTSLHRWKRGIDESRRATVMADVMMAVVELESTLDLLPLIVRTIQREAASSDGAGSQASAAFVRLAGEYERDARHHNRTMTVLYIVAAAALISAFEAAIWAAGVTWSQFAARGLVVVVALIAAAVAMWQADRHRRAGAEQLRLAHQMRAFPSFIDQMSSDILQDFMRGTLTPRFFPRAFDDDDVLREPLWPNPDQLRSVLVEEVASDEESEGGGRNLSSETQAST